MKRDTHNAITTNVRVNYDVKGTYCKINRTQKNQPRTNVLLINSKEEERELFCPQQEEDIEQVTEMAHEDGEIMDVDQSNLYHSDIVCTWERTISSS